MKKKQYKKYFNATLATAVAATGASVVAPNTTDASTSFKDVPSTHNFYNDVTNLSERSIIKGFEDGTFRPGENVTRGQVAKIIAGALGLDTKNVKNPGFKDIPTTHQYYGAIAALANAGIISGYEDGTFRPGEPVQRNHMAKIIAGAFNLQATPNYTTPLTDVRSDYKAYVTALHEYGVTTGKTSTTFDGSSNVTRGQLAAFVVRAETVKNEENQVTFTIDSIADSKVQTSEGELSFDSTLQTIFTTANATALKNAEVKAVVIDGVIKSISSLTINTIGTQDSPVVFNGGKSTIAGNVTVNADYVVLNNTTVNGNVTLTEKVTKNFTSEGLVTNGELVIAEGTASTVAALNGFFANLDENLTVNLKNSSYNSLNVKRDNTAITSDKKLTEVKVANSVTSIEINADVEKVTVGESEKLTITGKGTVDQLSVGSVKELALEVVGTVKVIDVSDKNTKIKLGQDIEVTKLVVPEGLDAADVVSNYSSVKDKIGQVVDNKGSKVETSSGGGGSSRGDRDDSNSTPDNASVVIPSEITTAGTYGPASGNQTVQGNLTISSADVNLQNVTVTGNLILGEGIGEGDVHLQGVTVNGQTVVNGGGQNSVYFTDSVLATVIVNKNTGAVRIVAQGSTQVVEVQLETPTIVVEDELEGDSTGFEDIVVTEAMQSQGEGFAVQLVGAFETINSRATNVRINLSEETDIETLVLNAAAEVLGAGVIRTARINSEGSTISQRPQNVVLDINGSVRIGEDEITESYSDPSTTTSITSISANQGSISLEMTDFVADLSINNFIVKAEIDGQEVDLEGLQYNKNRQRITFNPIELTNNVGKTVEVTVTPNSEKITGETKTTSYVIETGFAGRITDIQGVGIPNLTIQFREGVGNRDGEVVGTATTDEYGYYAVNLPAGQYTGEFTSPGYLTTYMIGTASSDVFLTDQNETAMRAAASTEVKIMLTWGENPWDVDSHLTGPGVNGDLFHVYFGDKTEVENGFTYVDLDWDDTDSFGPETTTIRKLVDGEYRFIIHNYSGEFPLRQSDAKVQVYLGNSTTPDQIFNVPTSEGNERYWTVFDLIVSNNGESIEIVPVNTMQENVDFPEDEEEYYEIPQIFVNEQAIDPYTGEVFVSTGDTVSFAANEGTEIYYAINEIIDYENYMSSTLYSSPITINESSKIHVVAVRDGEVVGERFVNVNIGENPLYDAIDVAKSKLDLIPSSEEITFDNKDAVLTLVRDAEQAIYTAYNYGAFESDFEELNKISDSYLKIGDLIITPFAVWNTDVDTTITAINNQIIQAGLPNEVTAYAERGTGDTEGNIIITIYYHNQTLTKLIEIPSDSNDSDVTTSDTVEVSFNDLGDGYKLIFSSSFIEKYDINLTSIDTVSIAGTSPDVTPIVSTGDSIEIVSDTIYVNLNEENLINEIHDIIEFNDGDTIFKFQRREDTWYLVSEE